MAALVIGAVFSAAVAAAAAAQDVGAYARLPEMQSVAISPNGERIAFISGAERNATMVVVTSLDGSRPPVAVEAGSETIDDQLLSRVDWVSDNHLLLLYRLRLLVPGGGAEDADIGRQVIYSIEDNRFLEVDIGGATVIDSLPEDPDHILLSGAVADVRTTRNSVTASRGRNYGLNTPINLLQFNINTGRTRIVAEGTIHTANWVLGPDAQPVMRQDFDFEDRTLKVYVPQGRGWRMIYSERFTTERFGRDGRRPVADLGNLIALDRQGRGVWYIAREDRDKLRGYLFNPETGELSGPQIAPERFDMVGLRTDWRTRDVIGASWFEERRQAEWFVEPFASLQTQLSELFPTSDVVLSDWDRDLNRIIVSVAGGEASTDYYLLDRSTGELAFLQTQYPEIAPEDVHPVSVVQYQARDGLDLWGYLTLPNDRPSANLPMVLLPHGGPQARDFYGFDHWTQFLAEMGYAVFQPQFRGGEGMGRRFIEAGHGEWGRKMQSDLSDAVLHLVDTGLADADRVCIFGWSYGGYAALAGYAFTPDLYRCVIAGAPVSDILTMMEYEENRQGGASVNYWTEYIGDWRTQRELMVSISPARNVVRSDLPLMLIHGEEDIVVPIEQAEIMADAMTAAGNEVDFVRIADDGHNLLFRRTRAQTLEALQRFLLEHNPPD